MGQCWRSPKRTQPSLCDIFDSAPYSCEHFPTRETNCSPLSVWEEDAQELDASHLYLETHLVERTPECCSGRSYVQSPRNEHCLATGLLTEQ